MRNRKIKKYGDSWIIKLEPADATDFKLEEGQEVDVEELLSKLLNKTKK